MTDQERLSEISKMEKRIRNFKIIVSGGDIEGGFGHLPKSDDLFSRIDNIEHSINKFQIEGNQVNIAGSFDHGFQLS